ncbi:MAG: FliM/FliN family flagellar motor C-terminal domain-containing protein [Pseudomonadota bacterium]
MSPAKALRLALAQAGEDLLGAAILSGTVEEARTTVPQIADLIEDGALVMLLQGSGRSHGLAILDAGALTAVIEALTTGRISAGEPPSPPRVPTATDAFLSGRFLTRIVGAFSGYLDALPDADWAGEYSATEQVRDVRSLPLLLEDLAFRAVTAPLDFDAGARQGTLRLILPWGRTDTLPKALPAPVTTQEDNGPAPAHSEDALRALMLGVASLEAVLHRQRLPLAGLLAWKPGDLVTFPAHAIATVALVDAAGTTVATGRLGQANGQRALKVLRSEAAGSGLLSPLSMATARAAVGLAPKGDPDDPEPTDPKKAPDSAADPPVSAPVPDMGGVQEISDPTDLPQLPSIVD